MGWFKRLKKRLTIKNVLKGFKGTLKLVPGGSLISQGIGMAEKAVKEASKVFGKKPEGKGVKIAQVAESELSAVKAKSNVNILLLVGIGAIAFFIFTKGK